MNKFLVLFEKSSTGYGAYAPDLPGCVATGRTLEETRGRMAKAMEMHVSAMREDGEPIPTPGGPESYRKVMKDLDVNRYVLGHVQVDIKRVRALASHLG